MDFTAPAIQTQPAPANAGTKHLGRFADSPRGLPNRFMMEWRSVALGHFDRLLAEDHTQQADQCDERRGRRPDMDKPVSRPNGETHDEGEEIADHDGLPCSCGRNTMRPARARRALAIGLLHVAKP